MIGHWLCQRRRVLSFRVGAKRSQRVLRGPACRGYYSESDSSVCEFCSVAGRVESWMYLTLLSSRTDIVGYGDSNSPHEHTVPCTLLKQLDDRHVLLAVLLHDLGNRHIEVLLCDVDAALSQREHARLGTHRLNAHREQNRNNSNSGRYSLDTRAGLKRTRRTADTHSHRLTLPRLESYAPPARTLHSAPEHVVIFSATLRRLMPRMRFIFREWIFRICSRACRIRTVKQL